MSILYVDPSILVSIALGDDRGHRAERIFGDFETTGTSELAVVEAQAGVSSQVQLVHQRMAAEGNLNHLFARLHLYTLDSKVLGRARALVSQYRVSLGLRTLDAVHLATADLVKLSLPARTGFQYLTADRRQHEAFTAEGYVGQLLA